VGLPGARSHCCRPLSVHVLHLTSRLDVARLSRTLLRAGKRVTIFTEFDIHTSIPLLTLSLSRFTVFTMLPTLARRMATAPKPQLTTHTNPFKTKKVWPPDFSKLSTHEQFRYEKKYKRRLKLATARPTWNKMIKLGQLFSITCMCAAWYIDDMW